MKKDDYLDDEERELIESYHSGEMIVQKISESEKKELQQIAKNTIARKVPISIRLAERDIRMVKVRAMEEGIPYQTLVSSILHKYVTNRLVPA